MLLGGPIAVGVGAVWSLLVSTVSRWFVARRVLALGLAVLGSGSGVFFIAPLAEFLIATAGWRLADVWLGAISGDLIVLAAFFLVRDPAARGSMPYGANAGEIDSPAPNSGPGGRLFDFLTVPHFWRVTSSFGLWWFAGAIVYI